MAEPLGNLVEVHALPQKLDAAGVPQSVEADGVRQAAARTYFLNVLEA